MHNAYVNSTIYAVRCKESFSLSFNGYSNFCYERFDRTSSYCLPCCGCYDCCSVSTYRVPIKPCLINGLRQSALLQLSASRRLILGGGDYYLSQLPAYGFLRDCHELNSSVNERTVCNDNSWRMKGRYVRAASRKGREFSHSFGSDDAEAVLSLLSEEAEKGAICSKCKNVSSSQRKEVERKRKNVSRERHLSLSEKVETEKKGDLKQHGSSTIDLRREYEKPNKEREASAKSENHRKRIDVSSCSSYYSLSSGDFGSDLEVQDEIGLEESSLEYGKEEANHVEEQVKEEEFNRQGHDSKKLQDVSNNERIAFGADIDWNLRKKSEKKLTEGTLQETDFSREHQDKHSREFRTHESGHKKSSISQMRVNREEEKSSFVDNLDKKTNKSYIQTINRRNHQSVDVQDSGSDEVETALLSQKEFSGREGKLEISETLLKETTDKHKFVGSTTGRETSKSKKAFSGREGNLVISETLLQEINDEQRKFVGSTSTSGKDVIDKSSQKYTGSLKIEDTGRTSNTRMKDVGVKKVSVLSSFQGVEKQQHQKGEKIITQAKDKERRKKSEQFSEVSEVHGINIEDTSVTKPRTRLQNVEEKSNISSDARVTWLQTDNRTNQSFQHRKGSELVNTSSEGNASDKNQVSSSQKTYEKVKFIPKSKSTSVPRTRESSSQTEERIANFELVREDQRSSNLSISDETTSREASSSQGSLNLVSGAGKRVILTSGDGRSSSTMLIPSSSQMGGGSVHGELTEGIAGPKTFFETTESSSSALYDNDNSGGSSSLHPDALGSADRLEKSSSQFFDEFVEKIRHEVTTSEVQGMEIVRTELPLELDGNQIYGSRQQGTQIDVPSKEHDSSHSSGFPGTKGPSDEMWDVMEPSVEQGPIAKETETSQETGKAIVTRSGKSLWSMISDLVRLRWGSRAGSSTSAGKSAERNSPNKSDSDTWFSGQEHEETTKTNVVKETSVLRQAMTSDKLKPGKQYTQSEGEVYDNTKLKDKGKHVEVGPSSPNTLASGSVSIGASYTSGEENASWTEDKDLKTTTSGSQNIELPISVPARGPPIVGEIVSIGGSDMSITKSLMPMKELVAPVQSELSSSERKDGELKQRKFQRTRQVLRDRFDDWEEAYQREFEQRRIDEMFMREALLEAKKAADTWEVPVGAVLVQHGKIIARGCNLVEELRDSTAHAEMICIREASNLLRTWRLSDTTLYVTLEPCPMCAGAILQARIDTVVWGAPNKLLGADGSWIRLFPDGGENVSEQRDMPPAPVHPFHPKMKIRRGVLAAECADAMQQFFQLRRKKKKEEPQKDPSCLPVTHHNPSKLLNKMHDLFHMMFCL